MCAVRAGLMRSKICSRSPRARRERATMSSGISMRCMAFPCADCQTPVPEMPIICATFGEHGTGGKEFFGKPARRAASAAIIALHRTQGRDRVGFVAEELQAEVSRQVTLGTGRLHHAGTPAREVADGAVADPAGRRLDDRGLGAAEFAARGLDIAAISRRRAGDLVRIDRFQPFRTISSRSEVSAAVMLAANSNSSPLSLELQRTP